MVVVVVVVVSGRSRVSIRNYGEGTKGGNGERNDEVTRGGTKRKRVTSELLSREVKDKKEEESTAMCSSRNA